MIASTSGGVRFFKIGLRLRRACSATRRRRSGKLLEATETVARVAHHFAGPKPTLPSRLANSSSPTKARMIFCSLVIVVSFRNAPRPGAANPDHLRPASASASAYDTNCQIKS